MLLETEGDSLSEKLCETVIVELQILLPEPETEPEMVGGDGRAVRVGRAVAGRVGRAGAERVGRAEAERIGSEWALNRT